LMGYYFFPGQGSSGWLPSSVEYSPCSSTVAAQTYEGPDYQIIYSQTKCQ